MNKTNEVPHYSMRKVLVVNVVILVLTFVVMYELFPHFTQNVVFDGVLRKGWYILPVVGLAWLTYGYYKKNKRNIDDLGAHRRPLAVFMTLSVLVVLWFGFVFTGTDYLTYKFNASDFTERNGLIPSAPDFVRFTPLQNACNDLGNSISATGEHVGCDMVQPIITEHGFGYAAPITPSGLLNTFLSKNPGFLVLDDSSAVSNTPEKRIDRIDEVQQIGQSMEWFDNLQYALATTDFFANFDTPHFLALNPDNQQELTLVVPKIKYGFLWRLPYWGGDVLVHSDGTVENLSADAVKADPRFVGKWVYPLSLAKQYVQLQNYGTGWGLLSPFVNVHGKLDIEQLSGGNQFPFLTEGNDGKSYLVTATKGTGSAKGLFRMYYVDASTGVGTFHQFGPKEVVYGAATTMDRMTNISGYQWHQGEGSSGTIIATEPVYIVRPNDPTLYWKFTITNVNYSGISATAVVSSSRPDDILVFKKRSEFEAWLRGQTVASTDATPGTTNTKDDLLHKIDEMNTLLQELKQQVDGLPPG